MRASELLSSAVADASGRRVGQVRDVLLNDEYRLHGLVVGDGRLAGVAHSWGFASGRAGGPWLLRRIAAAAAEQALFVPAGRVVEWGPGTLTISGDADDLPRLAEELRM